MLSVFDKVIQEVQLSKDERNFFEKKGKDSQLNI